MPSTSFDYGYQQEERVLLHPVARQKTVDWEVHLESTTSVGANALVSPLPPSARALLKRFKASRLLIQVASGASSSFPASELDLFVLKEDDLIRTMGSAGVTVTLDFPPVVEDIDSVTDTSIHVQKLQIHFQAVLRELMGQRMFVSSSLASTEITRLYNFIQHELVSTPKGRIHRFSVRFPSDGGPSFSAEGIRAWLNAWVGHNVSDSPKSVQGMGGFWTAANSSTWSNWMLGTTNDNNNSDWSSATRKRRCMWIELQSTDSCRQKPDTNSACRYSMSLGAQYTRRVPHSSHSKATISLKDIIPSSQKYMQTSTVAMDSRVELFLAKNSPFQLPKWGTMCSATESFVLGPDKGSLSTCGLSKSESISIQVDDPLLEYRQVQKSRPSLDDLPYSRLWQVNFHIFRPLGLAHHGSLQTTLFNRHTDCPVDVIVFQRIPNIISPVWKSLHLRSSPLGASSNATRPLEWADLEHYDIDFGRDDGAIHLFYQYEIDAASSLELTMNYDPAFLSLDSFPGDPNRGVELPPVRARFVPKCGQPFTLPSSVNLTSDSALLLPPLPDMSMPFNVLSMVCTLYAFVVGSIMSLSIRKASQQVKYALDPSKKPKSKVQLVRDKLSGLIRKIKCKVRGSADKDTDESGEATGSPESTDTGAEASKETNRVSDATSKDE